MLYYRLAHWISAVTKKIAQIYIPRPCRGLVLGYVAKALKIDLKTAEKSIFDYRSINELFTRGLKPEIRPIGESWMVTPVDGRLVSQSFVHEGQLLQVKNIRYPLHKLIPDPVAAAFRFGYVATMYLSPSDCHRIFSPVTGRIVRTIYVPGALFPVREPYISELPGLYALNERVVTIIETSLGKVAVVMVAAINVSCMTLAYAACSFSGNQVKVLSHDLPIEKGTWLATFHLGSTVVLLSEKKDIKPVIQDPASVSYGMSLGYV